MIREFKHLEKIYLHNFIIGMHKSHSEVISSSHTAVAMWHTSFIKTFIVSGKKFDGLILELEARFYCNPDRI